MNQMAIVSDPAIPHDLLRLLGIAWQQGTPPNQYQQYGIERVLAKQFPEQSMALPLEELVVLVESGFEPPHSEHVIGRLVAYRHGLIAYFASIDSPILSGLLVRGDPNTDTLFRVQPFIAGCGEVADFETTTFQKTAWLVGENLSFTFPSMVRWPTDIRLASDPGFRSIRKERWDFMKSWIDAHLD